MRKKVVALVAAVTLVFALFVVIQAVDTSPAGAGIASSASVGGDAAQVNVPGIIAQIVCPILLSVRNAFASTPFAGFVNPILNALLAAFGCAPS